MDSKPQCHLKAKPSKGYSSILFSKSPVRHLSLALLFLVGCQFSTVAESDPLAARKILQSALQEWSAGRTTADLRSASPPVYVAEDLWESGNSLVEFSLDANDQMIGGNVCIDVSLKTKSPSGQIQNKKLRYLVTTTPAHTIARLDQ